MEHTNNQSAILAALRSIIGQRLRYQQHHYQVIEVLETEVALVLQCEDDTKSIQQDQYGNPHRRVAKSITLLVFTADGISHNEDFLQLCAENGLEELFTFTK